MRACVEEWTSETHSILEVGVSITLTETLDLVGRLDDTPGEETPRERFRRRLHDKVREVGQVRDYIEECLRTPGDQYNRAEIGN